MGLKDLVSKKPTTLYFDGSYYDTIDELLADCQIDKADYNNERSAHRDWEPVNVVDNLVKNKKGVLPSKIKAIKAAEEKAAALKAAAEAKAAQEARIAAEKAAEEAKKAEEVKVETPVVEEPKVEAEVIPETVATAPVDAPILNEEVMPKKTRKKKEVVEETPAEPAAEPTIEGLD